MANAKRFSQMAIKLAAIVLVAVALPILFARCTPRWFPDSQAFAFVTGAGDVQWHSLKTGETKKLPIKASPMSSVAVWPTGDRLAVAQLDTMVDPPELQIRIVDLAGDELHASPKLPLKGKGEKGTAAVMLQLDVSPDGKHVVAFAPFLQAIAIYDVDAKTFRTIEGAVSFVFVSGMIAGNDGDKEKLGIFSDVSSISPTGKGFVAMMSRGEEGANEMDFAWFAFDAAKPHVMPLTKELEAALTLAGERKLRVAMIPSWKHGVLSMHLDDQTLEIDTAEKAVRLEKNMAADHLLQHAEREKVRVLAELRDGAIVQVKEKTLQLWRRDAEPVALGKLEDDGVVSLAPSPDGQRLLVRTLAERDVLRVFDRDGRKLAELDFASPVMGR